MTLLERVALVGSFIDDEIITDDQPVDLLVEHGNGGLPRSVAVKLLARRPRRMVYDGDDWVPLRDWDGRWPR